jgi:uncharacterized membrane protein YphA (DoxX/SURF4 family)
LTPRDAVALALRLGLAALFLYAGAVKLADPAGFAVDIANYRVLPAWLVPPLAAMLPGVEIACGACLLWPRARRSAAWLTLALLGAFTLAVGQALARGINLECGCFGASRAPVTVATLGRDLALVAAAGLALALGRGQDARA